MNIYKNFIYLAILSAVGFLFLNGLNLKDSDNPEVDLFDLNHEQKEKVLNIIRLSSNSKNKKIENIKILSSNGNYTFLKDIIGDTPKIVFRFNENQCSAYIDYTLDYLKKNENKIGLKNIILIGDFFNSNSHSVFNRLHPNLQQEIYNIDKSFNLPVDSLPLPYLLIINNSLKSREVFVPIKEIPRRTDIELDKILNRTF